MKYTSLLFLLLFTGLNVTSQDWSALGDGSGAASYDGTGWTAYPWDENLGGVVNDFEVFNDRLFAAGEFGFWQGTEIAATCVMFDETSPNH
jgi:hypothetical protein